MADTFYDQIAANRRNSFLMAAFVVALLARPRVRHRLRRVRRARPAASARPGSPSSSAALAGVGTYFAGDSLVLSVSGAKEVDETHGAAADQRRARDGDRGQRADAARLRHRRHRPQRLRDRPRPEARHRWRSRPACSRSSIARSSRASSATSSRTSATRHPLLAHRRGHGRGDRHPRRLLPALHVLGRRRPQPRPRRRRWRRPGHRVRRRDRAGHPGADHRAVHPDGRQPPARVPRRRVSDRADPQPVRPGARAGQDLRATGRSSRSPTAATQHLYFANPIKKFEQRSSQPHVDPPGRSSTGSTACAS